MNNEKETAFNKLAMLMKAIEEVEREKDDKFSEGGNSPIVDNQVIKTENLNRENSPH